MGFRVAHAGVELQRLDLALRVDHQAGIQEAGERNAVRRHAVDGGQDDFAHRPGVDIGRHHRRGRVRAHAAGVRAGVPVADAFVILAGGQRQHILAIAQHDEAGFFALQEFFNHHACAARVVNHAQGVVFQHETHGFVRFFQRHGHDHAFASSQAVGLHHDGGTDFVDVGVRGGGVGEGVVSGGRDFVALHEVLGEGLGAFKLCSGLGRAKDAQTTRTEYVHHTLRQRRFRANDGQRDALFLREVRQRHRVADGDVGEGFVQCGAAVARRHKHPLHLGALRQFPRQRVFPPTRTDHEHVHSPISAL